VSKGPGAQLKLKTARDRVDAGRKVPVTVDADEIEEGPQSARSCVSGLRRDDFSSLCLARFRNTAVRIRGLANKWIHLGVREGSVRSSFSGVE